MKELELLEGENGVYSPKEDPETLGVAQALYYALLESSSKRPEEYITIHDGHRASHEIRCALKHSSIFQRPFARTEEDAKNKLSAWLEKRRLAQYQGRDQGTNTVEPLPVNQPARDNTLRNADTPDCPTPPVPLNPPFAMTEADAVRALRERGYRVFPNQSPTYTGIITPPPEYSRYPSSQPTGQIDLNASGLASKTNTRKRKAASLPSTPIRERCTAAPPARPADDNLNCEIEIVDSDSEEETEENSRLDTHTAHNTDSIDDANDASDEMCETPPRQHKRRKITTTETTSASSALQRKRQDMAKAARARRLQKPSTPPRCRKTKQSTLTSVFSRQEVADQTGIPIEDIGAPTQAAEIDSDIDESAVAAHDSGEDEIVVTEDGVLVTEGGILVTAEQENSEVERLYNAPSPEEECASNLLALQASQPSTPPAAPSIDACEESLPVPGASTTAPQHLEHLEQPTYPDYSAAISQWPAEDRRLFLSFMEDARAAEPQWKHPSTYSAIERFKQDPYKKFQDCLAIARKTLGDTVLDEWDSFLEQGRPPQWRNRGNTLSSPAVHPDPCQSADPPTPRAVARAAYSEFQIIDRAKTSHWKAAFEYRRAAARLNAQCDAYLEICNRRSLCESGIPQQDQTSALKALFREMNPEWRNALPANFSEPQAKAERLWRKWCSFHRANGFGRRWRLFVQELGCGALLFIDTTNKNCFLQQDIPGPVFAAWVKLLARVTTNLKDIGDRMYPYFDGLKNPSTELRPIRLEVRAYRAYSPSAQFDQTDSDGDGNKTLTVDPGRIVSEPSASTGMDVVVGQMHETDGFEFIHSS